MTDNSAIHMMLHVLDFCLLVYFSRKLQIKRSVLNKNSEMKGSYYWSCLLEKRRKTKPTKNMLFNDWSQYHNAHKSIQLRQHRVPDFHNFLKYPLYMCSNTCGILSISLNIVKNLRREKEDKYNFWNTVKWKAVTSYSFTAIKLNTASILE